MCVRVWTHKNALQKKTRHVFLCLLNMDEQTLKDQIKELLEDEILSDLVDPLPMEEDIDALIAVEQGQAYQITVNRDPLPSIRKLLIYHLCLFSSYWDQLKIRYYCSSILDRPGYQETCA